MKFNNKRLYFLISVFAISVVSTLYAGSYENGLEFYKQKSYQKAIDSFNIAVNNNDNRAMLALGIIYANGDGITKDNKKSFEWIKKSALAGNSYAYMKLANIYASQDNFKDAFKWFEKSAKLGNSQACYNLGYFYTGGLGVERDLKESLKWYKKSALAGNIDAQLNLSFMYISGHGTSVNYKEAAYWIKKAKDSGSGKAELMWKEFQLDKYYVDNFKK